MGPTVVVDLVHAQLSLHELAALAQHGLDALSNAFLLARQFFCSLPFAKSC